MGIAAPSGAFDRRLLKRAIDQLRQWELEPVIQSSIYSRHRYFAGTAERRRKELQALFDHKNLRAILFARGGFGLHQILPSLRWSGLKRYPKRIIGYSDLTMLLDRVQRELGLVTYYGPTLCDLGRARTQSLARSYRKVLFGNGTKQWSLGTCRIIRSGRAEGRVVGGCLTLVNMSVGTGFEMQTRGGLLFLEDVNESVYRVERLLLHLKQAGKLRGVRGIVLSRFTDPDGGVPMREWRQMFAEVLKDFSGPIVYGFRFGHHANAHIVPLGYQAVIDTRRAWIRIKG